MRKISKANAKKFNNHVKNTIKDFDFTGISYRQDCEGSCVYSFFLRFEGDIPEFADNQFSGKHNFHYAGAIECAIAEFTRYFERVVSQTK